MGEWKTVKLAEVLRHRKGHILINNNEEYSLCRVQLHRRGVVLRGKKMGSQIKTKKQQVCRAGDLVVAEMDAKFGGYGFIPDHLDGAIVSSHYYLYELDKNKITQEYLEILIKTDFIQNQIEAKGSTNYSSIRAWEFLDYEIPLQSIAFQNSIASKYVKYSRFKEALGIEITAQLKYLSQLRQQILQEAIEGKLTAKWRNEHPDLISGDNHASKLLEKIKAEKQTLTENAKYTKKDKPLPPITDTEKPFDLPDGWVWCRLGSIVQSMNNGLYKPEAFYKESGVVCLRMYNIQDGKISFHNLKKMVLTDEEIKTYSLLEEDLLLNRVNSIELLGKAACIKECSEPLVYESKNIRIRFFNKEIFSQYINIILLTDIMRNQILKNYKKVTGQASINQEQLSSFLIPLPPLAEQQAIVERVDKIISMIDKLEKQVTERKEQSEMLMQSVLREAFAKG